MLKRLSQHPWPQAALAHLLGRYLAVALRTTRWTLHGEENVARHFAGDPAVVAFWHERLPMMPVLWFEARRRGASARVNVLVSRHRDGRFIGAVVSRFGLQVVHGSSSRGGATSVRTMLGLLERGEHVAITPDGPRGPRRRAAAGVAQVAAVSGVAVLPCGAQTTRRRVMQTWDRMVVPLPFGRGVIVCGTPVAVARDEWQEALPAIEQALTEAAELADRLCGA
ncbi:MAG: lysophospholipid acyltransferase family protein [Acidisphaera sp.]|nr:lysophospholipid acyltransferase family protein [Acidisphaera sp.]